MTTLFLAWQDPLSRTWFPVGKLTQAEGLYHFTYLQGALEASKKAGFSPIPAFPDFYLSYRSAALFPLFANRLLRRSRPEYSDFVQWLNLPEHTDDPIALLARSGGQRKTDYSASIPHPLHSNSGYYATSQLPGPTPSTPSVAPSIKRSPKTPPPQYPPKTNADVRIPNNSEIRVDSPPFLPLSL